jgi:hypothetical protein
LRIKEQETLRILHEHDDDDDVRELVEPKPNYLYDIFVRNELTKVSRKVRVARFL